MAAPSPHRQRMVKARLAELFAHPMSVYVIHYACQSLDQAEAHGSPRIASIVVRNLGSRQTQSFSIHQELELMGLAPHLAAQSMDALELAMLDRYFRFLSQAGQARLVHWRMSDVRFGFAAIEHRYRVLGGRPVAIAEHQRFDLSAMLVDAYGTEYVPSPHFEGLASRNGISLTGYIAGREEPVVFNRGEFGAVLRSTLTKVGIISTVTERMHDGTLRTDASAWALNTGRLREAVEGVLTHPVYALAAIAFAGIGSFITALRWLLE